MVYVAKDLEIREFHPTRKRGVNRKPLNRVATLPDSIKPFNTPLKPQLEQWLAESWADNKELYMALAGR
jgi:hypothetical protein